MYQFRKFVKLADKLILNQANNHFSPILISYNFQNKIIKNTQFRMNSSLIINVTPKKNDFISFNGSFKINFIQQQKRFYNENTNASSVWDPYPVPTNPLIDKSAETALDEANYKKSRPQGGQSPPSPHQVNQSGRKKYKINISDLFSPRVRDAVLTTVMGIAAVGFGGVVYHTWYEWHEVHKVLKSFLKPAYLLKSKIKEVYFAREEYQKIFSVVAGDTKGKYYLLVGENGTGKTQLVLRAMDIINHYGVVFCEAHSDTEIFKTRLGRALNYTFREDYIGGLFAREAPERGSALLDVEKALNMVEEVAYKHKLRHGRPFVLIINNIHNFKDDEDGCDLLELLQQRAEAWASSGFVTMIFNTDDYSVYERMKMDASHMETIRVHDLEIDDAMKYLKDKRRGRESDEVLMHIVKDRIGGRLSYLSRLTKEPDVDIFDAVNQLEDEEETWLINTIGLIPNFDGPEYESQKYALAAWKLIKEMIKSPTKSVTLSMGRDITGNPRYLKKLDHDGVILIDTENHIKPDSQISINFFEKIVKSKGFEEKLAKVEKRLEQVEREERTRELIWSNKNKRSWWI
ncbi:unnamed protein product [Rhizophagus irregularis]|nr:unnamed protein product [Rhizophagus irregularis]